MTQTPVVAAKLVLGGAKGSDVSKVSRNKMGNTKRWYVFEIYSFRIYQTGQGNDSVVFVSCLLFEHWTLLVVVYTSRCFSPTSGHMILLKMVNIHETCRSIWTVTRSFSSNHHSFLTHRIHWGPCSFGFQESLWSKNIKKMRTFCWYFLLF